MSLPRVSSRWGACCGLLALLTEQPAWPGEAPDSYELQQRQRLLTGGRPARFLCLSSFWEEQPPGRPCVSPPRRRQHWWACGGRFVTWGVISGERRQCFSWAKIASVQGRSTPKEALLRFQQHIAAWSRQSQRVDGEELFRVSSDGNEIRNTAGK